MKNGPLILIDDDADDRALIKEILDELPFKNEQIWFTNTIEAFNFLKQTASSPFLIICDENLPKEKGLQFKRRIDNDPQLRKKSIPFIFYTLIASTH